ncbi:PrsW family intramembrane metalloprotease [Nonomuraea africana]|uniref:RsiW-degrading membrane proteinase PrsW (M82 family) n=1 Tax=Nonomuraea africana TaxID=46171 RepID=A0ABR9K854_9ACTN|nr:PrsW family intramembrane metalloprotease [Nonomuraea africana]MBE1557981.1 RsiW-degrading membrane proteinase PrsW (M82 family) [Nonomuraea africana]
MTRPPVLSPRPSKALIIGLVISSVCALLMLALMLVSSDPKGFGLSAVMAVAPLPVLLAAVLALDRLEPEPKLHLAFAFAWGAGVAVVVAIALSLAGAALVLSAGYGEAVADDFGTVILAPVIEEALKGSALLLLLRRRKEIDGLTDGIIYAAMAGLGFAAVENVGYYLSAYAETGTGGAVGLFVFRGLIAPLGHPVYTSMIGIGVAYAATRRTPMRFLAIPLGYLGAVVLHGLWNGAATLGSLPALGGAYLLALCVIVALVVVTVRERKRVLSEIGGILPAYLPTGLVSPQDVGMLSSLRSRRDARRWAKGHGLGKPMADYQQAATELSMLHLRAAREGMPVAEFETQRDALLHVMATTRRW